jgi:hypothetical protein
MGNARQSIPPAKPEKTHPGISVFIVTEYKSDRLVVTNKLTNPDKRDPDVIQNSGYSTSVLFVILGVGIRLGGLASSFFHIFAVWNTLRIAA